MKFDDYVRESLTAMAERVAMHGTVIRRANAPIIQHMAEPPAQHYDYVTMDGPTLEELLAEFVDAAYPGTTDDVKAACIPVVAQRMRDAMTEALSEPIEEKP